MPKRKAPATAKWNQERDLWERLDPNSGQWVVYSETLPPSGTMRNGVWSELPKSVHPTNEPESLSSLDDKMPLLRTPCASEAEGGPLHPDTAKARGQTLRLTGQILALTGDLRPTPTVNLGGNGGSQDPAKCKAGGHSVSSQDVVEYRLLPTPTAINRNENEEVADWDKRRAEVKAKANNGNGMGEPLGIAAKRIVGDQVAWLRYESAIRRWERIFGRKAPAPTAPTGRNGAARLSSRFVEWMMGLADGWVTSVGLTRAQELKALGNGVVPQQAVLALKAMLPCDKTQLRNTEA